MIGKSFDWMIVEINPLKVNYRVLRKYLNQGSKICRQFETREFRYFCKKQ